MLISGFIDGRLIYIFEFPFNTKQFSDNLKEQLEKKFPNRKRKENDFLRSASFTYKNFLNDKNVKLIYILKKRELNSYKDYIDKNLFLELLNYAK
jgi:hypothetical protein